MEYPLALHLCVDVFLDTEVCWVRVWRLVLRCCFLRWLWNVCDWFDCWFLLHCKFCFFFFSSIKFIFKLADYIVECLVRQGAFLSLCLIDWLFSTSTCLLWVPWWLLIRLVSVEYFLERWTHHVDETSSHRFLIIWRFFNFSYSFLCKCLRFSS